MGESRKSKREKKKQEEPKSFSARLWQNWIKPIGIAALLVFTFRSSLADWNDVPSASMEPTILIGDRVFVNKLAYDLKFPFTKMHLLEWGGPERGDIVIWFRPDDGTRMVKRIIGVPGDEIELKNNQLLINGEPLDYLRAKDGDFADVDYTQQKVGFDFYYEDMGDLTHPIMVHFMKDGLGTTKPYQTPGTVPEGHYFVMGDNRDHSNDSRMFPFTFVPRRQIVGKVTGIAFSLDRKGGWSPRWDRFLSGVE